MSFNETYVTYVLNWFGCVIRCCWCRKGTSWYFKACGSVRIEACLISTVFLYYMYTCIFIYILFVLCSYILYDSYMYCLCLDELFWNTLWL